MATWIVHLRLAENLLERIAGLDAASFAIGSIAPDSVTFPKAQEAHGHAQMAFPRCSLACFDTPESFREGWLVNNTLQGHRRGGRRWNSRD